MDVNFKEIRDIIKIHWQLYPDSTEINCILFFDEPQMIENWEIAVRALNDEGFEIYLTGSSSRLLSREISTSLRGRTLSYLMLPFSFTEFLNLKQIGPDPLRLSSREKSKLNEYFNLVVYRDVIERYKIKNTQLIKWLVKSLTVSYSKEFSVHKHYLTLKSKGIKVSKNTLYSYLSMLEDSVFVFLVPRFDYSIRKRELSIHKAYLCDVGYARLTEISGDYGKKMENMVFLELERRKRALTDIFYWKNQQQEEVDFVVQTGGRVEQLIQVSGGVDNVDVMKREVRALIKASDQLECDDLLVITEDYDSVENHKGKNIRFMPLWMWLMAE